jgi:tetratricopeptide (TPR) repeat protein
VPLLRDQPRALNRLAACFFWQLVRCGGPDEVQRYGQIFGPPPDDPLLDRLSALCAEAEQGFERAHQHWQCFEQTVARDPAPWHGQADRVRALVWQRMGDNAAQVPDDRTLRELPPFLRDHPDRPRPLKPSADQCYERSLELAPDRMDAHEALIGYWNCKEKPDRAETAVRRLLARFPGQAKGLEKLADLLMRRKAYPEAIACFGEALRANPLERRLRDELSYAHLCQARVHADAGEFEQARAGYRSALEVKDGDSSVYCKWAACEFRAKDLAKAEELYRQAQQGSTSRVAASYHMTIEAIRLKLPKKLAKRFQDEFQAGLRQPLAPADIVELARTAAMHHFAEVSYPGQKTHEKLILACVETALDDPFTAEQAEALALALLYFPPYRLLRRFLPAMRQRFPGNPWLWFLEADSYFRQGPEHCHPDQVMPLLDKAAQLACQLPPDDRQRQLLEDIAERRRLLQSSNGFLGMINQLMDFYGDDDGDDDGWEEDEEEFSFGAPIPPARRRRKRK